jgi:hypothetical protein
MSTHAWGSATTAIWRRPTLPMPFARRHRGSELRRRGRSSRLQGGFQIGQGSGAGRPSVKGISPLLKHVATLFAIFRSVANAGDALDGVARAFSMIVGSKPASCKCVEAVRRRSCTVKRSSPLTPWSIRRRITSFNVLGPIGCPSLEMCGNTNGNPHPVPLGVQSIHEPAVTDALHAAYRSPAMFCWYSRF